MGSSHRKIVIVNQAVNYLTVGLANSFQERFEHVALVTGSVHEQGESLSQDVAVSYISHWRERPAWRKAISYLMALIQMWFLLQTKYRKYEVLFVSVPPMGYLLNLLLTNTFSMIIWDVYPDVLKVAGVKESDLKYRIWSSLNRRSFAKAKCIFTISDALADSISQYTSRDRVIVHPIWSVFQENSRIASDRNPFIREHGIEEKFVVQYSGNIGVTHNVESLIDIAAYLQGDEQILFQIIGRGPRQPAIERLLKERCLTNVMMLPFQSDEMFPFSLSAADIGVVILHSAVSKGSVPSKAYNLMSFGIPALYIASPASELAHYADRFENAACFRAEQTEEIADFIRMLASTPERHIRMQENAEQASRLFQRENAKLFVNSYLNS